jgi:hypothetical protein
MFEENIKMKLKGGCGFDPSGSGLDPLTGSCEYGSEVSLSIESVKCVD